MPLLNQNLSKPDLVGAMTSGLCAIHCMITPFIFLAKAGSTAIHVEVPIWYQMIDYLFIVISFGAVYFEKLDANSPLDHLGHFASRHFE